MEIYIVIDLRGSTEEETNMDFKAFRKLQDAITYVDGSGNRDLHLMPLELE
ncbi:hypothetical protein [Staphylococcus phage vB_SauM-V1SA09]|uniref:Uncharacterized protein n=1 Tax=Staphylococcus phage MCE-2014 TaxID=1524910 RepID=A0A076G4W0_9CAUD|nr:hypothetical protein OZ71_gp098 [Staphylococcus phage MCE-2014]AII26938.1 hypothetical protein [Staphylococcus phage MCE-2014]WOZ17460.1 hypothetical protein [Staphylococcus phage vB_SauM-V1SA09]VEV88213.1 hypothetical protein [Staphylococcus phage Stab20]